MGCLPNAILWELGNGLKGIFLFLNWLSSCVSPYLNISIFSLLNLLRGIFVAVFSLENGSLNHDPFKLTLFLLFE